MKARQRNEHVTRARLATAIALVVACSRDSETHAVQPATATAASQTAIAARAQANIRGAFAEASTRLLPFLDHLSAREELEGRLNEVAAAVEANDARALDRAVKRAERTLTRLQATDAASLYTTDLDAIRLALAEARRLLRATKDIDDSSHSQLRRTDHVSK